MGVLGKNLLELGSTGTLGEITRLAGMSGKGWQVLVFSGVVVNRCLFLKPGRDILWGVVSVLVLVLRGRVVIRADRLAVARALILVVVLAIA